MFRVAGIGTQPSGPAAGARLFSCSMTDGYATTSPIPRKDIVLLHCARIGFNP
jgi:hypothetical protein